MQHVWNSRNRGLLVSPLSVRAEVFERARAAAPRARSSMDGWPPPRSAGRKVRRQTRRRKLLDKAARSCEGSSTQTRGTGEQLTGLLSGGSRAGTDISGATASESRPVQYQAQQGRCLHNMHARVSHGFLSCGKQNNRADSCAC